MLRNPNEQKRPESPATGPQRPSAAGPSAAGPSATGPSATGPSLPGPSAAGPSSPAAGGAARRREPITLKFRDVGALQASYMGFIAGGGIFVPAVRGFEMGETVELALTLPEETEVVAITGKVCWITPAGVPGRPEGVGVQFVDDPVGEALRKRIEELIAGRIDPSLRSHTI